MLYAKSLVVQFDIGTPCVSTSLCTPYLQSLFAARGDFNYFVYKLKELLFRGIPIGQMMSLLPAYSVVNSIFVYQVIKNPINELLRQQCTSNKRTDMRNHQTRQWPILLLYNNIQNLYSVLYNLKGDCSKALQNHYMQNIFLRTWHTCTHVDKFLPYF